MHYACFSPMVISNGSIHHLNVFNSIYVMFMFLLIISEVTFGRLEFILNANQIISYHSMHFRHLIASFNHRRKSFCSIFHGKSGATGRGGGKNGVGNVNFYVHSNAFSRFNYIFPDFKLYFLYG